jgi:hypothetical protein
MKGFVVLVLLIVVLLNIFIGPIVIRLPLIQWTYHDNHAQVGWCMFPLFVALDTGPLGDAALPHELCHWHNQDWTEEQCDALYP